MSIRQWKPIRIAQVAIAAAALWVAIGATAQAKVPVKFKTMAGFPEPSTPANLNVVGVLKVGDPKAPNVLVLNAGTSASAAYFLPLAKTIAKMQPEWQVWAVERRENYLEDQSELDLLKQGRVSPTEFFDFYLGYLSNPGVTNHYQPVQNSQVPFARQWGMNTEINDLRVVVKAASAHGRTVVMGGHSLGGTITTAYATWDFNGRPGGRDLAGLVLIDGASTVTPVTADEATMSLNDLQTSSPWVSFGGIPAPLAGLFGTVGSAAAKAAPNGPNVFSGWPLLPANLRPPPGVNPSNEAGFGLSTDAKTSPPSLIAAQVHSGQLAASGDPRPWDRAGNITPIQRWASMFSGWGLLGHDGTAWYHPMRLTIDGGAVAEGVPNPAQAVLDVHSTKGFSLPKRMRIYAFGAALGGSRVLTGAQTLAANSRIPARNLKLVDRSATYAHNDPSSAQPKVNAFLKRLIPFLRSIASGKRPGSAKKNQAKR